jgi:hypothetical protein
MEMPDNMTPPNVHNTPLTTSKDNEVDEILEKECGSLI